MFSGEPVVGGVLEGGDLIVFAGSSQATNIQLIGVLIRQSTTASLATLSGPYHDLARFGRAPAAAPGTTPHWISSTGVANADGAGLLSFGAASINSDGMITTSPGGGSPADYAVAATGALSVQAGGFLGAVSPTGDFAVFAGATGTGGPPQFWFLLR